MDDNNPHVNSNVNKNYVYRMKNLVKIKSDILYKCLHIHILQLLGLFNECNTHNALFQ